MKQKEILKYICIPCSIYHVVLILVILIQVNESIEKLVTLMVEGHLNKVMEFKCNTYIIFW
jgi:hypothetical protein